ncbi:MAG: DegT/DnrJ/EryC1/StrS family aminotransferase, partial [Fidelibacterota bacterium]
PICYLGATPIFIDSELSSWNMCPKSLDVAFNNHKPKAVVVTDIYGQSANYESIKNICLKYNVPIIEDAAESLGAKYNGKNCGSFGEMAIISFNGNKIITTSGGGMLLSDNESYIEEAKNLSAQARENALHYEHKVVGFNYRMSNILAALGRAQLKKIDQYVEKRRKIFNYYQDNLGDIDGLNFMPEIKNGRSSRWLSVILLEKVNHINIEDIIRKFSSINIEVRPIWKPMHLQPVFQGTKLYKISKTALSSHLFEHGLCLPSGSGLSNSDQDKIIETIRKEV